MISSPSLTSMKLHNLLVTSKLDRKVIQLIWFVKAVFLTQIISRQQKCWHEKCIIDFLAAKMEFATTKCIFPNIQLKDVVNRLPPSKNLYDHTSSFWTG